MTEQTKKMADSRGSQARWVDQLDRTYVSSIRSIDWSGAWAVGSVG
jgi:hypothetical protein